MGRGHSTAPAADASGEQAFLFGLLGNRLGKLSLGIDVRPGRLEVAFPGGRAARRHAADQPPPGQGDIHGELGQPLLGDTRVDSFIPGGQLVAEGGVPARAISSRLRVHCRSHRRFNWRPSASTPSIRCTAWS
jgi:hypothetical protein